MANCGQGLAVPVMQDFPAEQDIFICPDRKQINPHGGEERLASLGANGRGARALRDHPWFWCVGIYLVSNTGQ
jgi:hypothetical protein